MTVDTSPPSSPGDENRPRHVRGRSAILDVVTDLYDDVAEASFPLDLPGTEELRELRERLETQIGAHLLPRLRREAAPAVVVLGGSTGAGKSTLVNSIVGRDVSEAGVVRPTTREPVLVASPDDAWLVEDHPITELARLVEDDAVPSGLALLDAPDLDSVVDGNRALGNLLLETADLWVFVTTAARYGDAVPWRVLAQAQQRGVTVAVVLNRVPRQVLAEVRGDLVRRMADLGLESAPLFVIRDLGPHEGLLPAASIGELRGWLDLLGGQGAGRGVARRTTQGVWAGLREELLRLADGISAQAMAAGELRSDAERAVTGAAENLATRLGNATDGAPTTRWLAAASSGGVLAPLTGDINRIRRGWRGNALRARTEAALAIAAETRGALEALLADACAEAETALRAAWSEPASGALDLLDGEATTDRSERVTAAVAGWARRTDELAERAIAADPRRIAKAIDVAGLGALLQAGAAGLRGAARVVRALLPDGAPLPRATNDLEETVAATVRAEDQPYLARLDSLGLRTEAGAGLRLRASELKGHR